jgi:hypothetical protein
MISVNDQNGTMIIYDNFMTTLSSHKTFTYLGAEYIATTFDANTRKAIVYSYNIQTFNIILVNVHNSPSKVFGSNANFLSHDNN